MSKRVAVTVAVKVEKEQKETFLKRINPPGKRVHEVGLRGLEPPTHGLGKREAAELALQAVLYLAIGCRASVLGVFSGSEIFAELASDES